MAIKKEYYFFCWGGFWNDGNQKIHNEPRVFDHWFDTEEERETEIKRLVDKADELRKSGRVDSMLGIKRDEGFLTRLSVTIRSVYEYEGRLYTVDNELGYGYARMPYEDWSGLDYMMEWKWAITLHDELDREKVTRLDTHLVYTSYYDKPQVP